MKLKFHSEHVRVGICFLDQVFHTGHTIVMFRKLEIFVVVGTLDPQYFLNKIIESFNFLKKETSTLIWKRNFFRRHEKTILSLCILAIFRRLVCHLFLNLSFSYSMKKFIKERGAYFWPHDFYSFANIITAFFG